MKLLQLRVFARFSGREIRWLSERLVESGGVQLSSCSSLLLFGRVFYFNVCSPSSIQLNLFTFWGLIAFLLCSFGGDGFRNILFPLSIVNLHQVAVT